jgi:two-component sensor histidine kinase
MCCEQLLARASIPGVSAGDPSVHVELEPTPTAARLARKFLDQHAEGVDAAARESASVCASELVTNGVLHARTPIRFGVTLGAGQMLVTVADQSDGRPEQPPHDDDRTSGRGLVLVNALASGWGVFDGGDGKTVWFTVPRARA